MEIQNHQFIIAEFNVCIVFHDTTINGSWLIPSFEPFRISQPTSQENNLFELVVDDELKPFAKEKKEHIRVFDTGNGDTVVDLLPNEGYQFIIKDINGHSCCLLQTDREYKKCSCALNGNFHMRTFGLNNALMLVFAFAASRYQTILIHASLVRNSGYGYAFIAKSGTGKSTQVSMWLRYIKGCDLMNDDNPIIRILNNIPYIYGSPWSGKTPCYRNMKARLGAVTQIERSLNNKVEPLKPIEAFVAVLSSSSTMKWDKDIFNNICDTITHIIEETKIYKLHCLPNREAAEICYQGIAKHD